MFKIRKNSAMTRFAALFFLGALVAMGVDLTPSAAQSKENQVELLPVQQRLQPKIQLIQKELPAWLKKSGNKEAMALMQKLGEQIDAKKYEEADKTADSLLKMMELKAPKPDQAGDPKPGKKPASSPEETTKRLTEKVERVMAGAQKWVASGRDPSEIIKTMQEKFQPLMKAGKIVEAEAVVDGVLKQLGIDVNTPDSGESAGMSDEEQVLARIHLIQKELPAWGKKTDKKPEVDALMLKLKGQLAEMNFAEAKKTADTILKLIGLSLPQTAKPKRVATSNNTNAAKDAKQAADPLAGFFPRQLVFLASKRISLTSKQRELLLVQINQTQPKLTELETKLESESTALVTLTSQERLKETAVLAQLNQMLDVERESRQLQARQGIAIHNVLTSEQHAQLRELVQNPEVIATLESEFKNRITAKIERVTKGAQTLEQSGINPSFVSEEMEQKVRPLMDSGRAFEAEAEIDRVLEMINKELK